MEIARKKTLSIGAIMFAMGACGLAYEYTFSKLSSDLLGNTVRQWAIIIGVMLFAMGVGADWQKRISGHRLIDKLVASQILLALAGSFGPMALLYVYSSFPYHFYLVLYGGAFLVGVLIGFEIPLLTRIHEGFEKEIRFNIAHILKMDYIGALFGAMLWVFLLSLVFRFGQIGFVVGLATGLTVLFTIWTFRNEIGFPWLWTGATVITGILLLVGLSQSVTWTLQAEQRLYQDRIVFSETTPYQHIVITESRSGLHRCYINGNLQFSSSDEFIYHENLVHPVMSIAPDRDRVLVLGGGDGLACREILKYKDVKEVVLVDIDPEMVRLAKEQPQLVDLNQGSLLDSRTLTLENEAMLEGEKVDLAVPRRTIRDRGQLESVGQVTVINMDAAKFVEQASGTFDVIIIDFPDPSSPELAKLHSRLFYRQIRNKLTAEGLFAVQSTSPVHAKEAFLCIGRTILASGLAAIPYHDNVPSFGEWGWWLGGRDALHGATNLKERLKTIEQLPVTTHYLNPALIEASLTFGNQQLLTSNTDINTLSGSEVYRYYLQAWKQKL